ncbi:MAG: protein kinase [Gemmatimonadales bacterium]
MTDSSAQRLARLMALFDEALDLAAGERAGWLAMSCADDPALRDEVAALLEAHDRPEGVLDRPPPVDLAEAPLGDRVRQSLSDRYLIETELGRGGMATVFLAHERKHDRRVVIKVLQPEIARVFGPQRFLDEVRIAAQLSHPHILGLIDSGEAGGLLYYVMPHVRGMPLRERLRREGAMPAGAAITLLRDVAAALAHAHQAGVVHRDLKPDNILCVGDHAFLMDFGIAQLEAEARRGERRTDPGVPLGTPGYMAPEQASGDTVDHRADLYAWGLLGRELLTGYPHPVTDLAARRPDVPAGLAHLVEACLQVDPAHRVQQAQLLVDQLDALLVPLSGSPVDSTPRHRRRSWGWVVAAGLAAFVVALLWWPRDGAPTADLVSQPVAVAVFRNETGDSSLATWGRMAGDWVTQGLHETGLFQVVAWPAVLHASEQWIQERASGGTRDLTTVIAEQTGAGTIVSGSYYLLGDVLRFQVEITDSRAGTLLGALPPVEVPRDSAHVAIQAVRDRVMGSLAVLVNERLATVPGLATRPPTFEAYRIFDRGLVLYNAQEYRAAVLELRRAAVLDSTFVAPLVHAAFGAGNTGQFALLDTLLGALSRRRTELNEYEEYQRQYLEAIAANDGPRALAAARGAAAVAPGSRSEYNAALTANALNQPAAALEHLRAVDTEHGLMRGWSSYWTQLAHALHLLGRHREELDAVRQARVRYPDRRVNLVLEARALAALGRTAAVDSLLAATESLPTDTYWSQGAMLVITGEELAVRADTAAARDWFARAVEWYRTRAFEPGAPIGHREWLALAHYHRGEEVAAARVLAGLVADDSTRLLYRGTLAVIRARAGDTTAATRLLRRPGPNELGVHTVFRARIAAVQGDEQRAIALLTEALGQGVDGWAWVHTGAWRDFISMREDPRLRRIMAPGS